ncbi:MAG: hypothetical protein ACK5LK_07660 [Chthoniobacterales bacterium]
MKEWKTRLVVAGGFLLLFWVLVLPKVVNHTEAEDAYSYARQVETQSYLEILHPHHRLYHPFAKWIYELSSAKRSFDVLVTLSLVLALLALPGFYFLLKRLGIDSRARAFCCTVALGLSYGYWRYAHEVEGYSMGILVAIIVLYALFTFKGRWQGVGAALLIVLALNVHRALGPPLLITALVLYTTRRDWRQLIIFTLVGTVIYFGTEKTMGHLARRPSMPPPQQNFENYFTENNGLEGQKQTTKKPLSKRLSLSSFPKAAVGFGSSIVGVNLLMGIDPVYDFLQNQLFPDRFLAEERMMAKGSPLWQYSLWGGCLIALGIIALLIGWRAKFDCFTWEAWSPEWLATIMGTGAYAGMITVFEPGNPEMWLLGLPFFWASAAFVTRKIELSYLVAFIFFLGLSSWLGGMALLGDPGKDYHRVTSENVRQKAVRGDIYLLGYVGGVHQRFVNYENDVTIIFLPKKSEKFPVFYKDIAEYLRKGNQIFVHQTVLNREERFGTDLDQFDLKFIENIDKQQGGQLFLKVLNSKPSN